MKQLSVLGVALTVIAGVLTGCSAPKPTQQAEVLQSVGKTEHAQVVAPVTADRRLEKFIEVKDQYLVNRPADRWLILSTSDTDVRQMRAVGKSFAADIVTLLRQGKTTSQLASEIASRFQVIDTGICLDEQKTAPLYLSESKTDRRAGFCLFPAVTYQTISTTVHYNYDMGMVAIRALQFPKPVLAGMVYHELGHNLWYLKGMPSVIAEPGSDLWIEEEVVMNELEGQIVNHFTGGKFFVAVDSFIKDHPAKNVRDLLLQMELSDMRAFDKIDGSSKCGQLTVIHSMFVRMIAIALYWVDKTQKRDGQERQSAKTAAYREADRLATTTVP